MYCAVFQCIRSWVKYKDEMIPNGNLESLDFAVEE